MNVFIVYAHPSSNSFTHQAKEAFIQGLREAGHSYEISDLYAMGFQETFLEEEYLREAFYEESMPILPEIAEEQRKVSAADVIVFIYPVFWTEAPAKLVGWFQRVWTYGYAYGPNASMPQLTAAVFLVTMGGDLRETVRREQVEAMKTVMLGDRINTRAKEKTMYVFDEMTRGADKGGRREEKMGDYLRQIRQLGREL